MVLNAEVEDEELVDEVPADETEGELDVEGLDPPDDLEEEPAADPELEIEPGAEEELEEESAEAWTPPSREVYEQLQQQAAQTQQLTQLLAIEQADRQRQQNAAAQQQQAFEQQRYMAAQQEQIRQQQAAQQFQWNAPAWDPANEQYLTYDAAGRVVAAAHCPDPRLPAQYHAFQKHQQDFVRNLAVNPMQALAPVLEFRDRHLISQMEQRFEQRLQQQHAAQVHTQTALGFVEDNREWMIQHDAQGRPVRDPQTQQFVFSPQGQMAAVETEKLLKYGVPLAEATQIAQRLVEREVLKHHTQQANAGQSAAAANAAQKKALQRGAVRPTARTGAAKKPGQRVPDREQTIDEIFRESGAYDLPPEAYETGA